MPLIALPAHFDGDRICLDEPFNLRPDTKLIVTILSRRGTDNEHGDWLRLSGQRLEDAYGEDEPEYSLDLLKEVNPDYEASQQGADVTERLNRIGCRYSPLPTTNLLCLHPNFCK